MFDLLYILHGVLEIFSFKFYQGFLFTIVFYETLNKHAAYSEIFNNFFIFINLFVLDVIFSDCYRSEICSVSYLTPYNIFQTSKKSYQISF